MTKIDIFSGFLGAGKTTLIKKLIAEAYKGEKLVLIENEFGETGIDGGFMKESGIKVNELNSGCICCSLIGDFAEALEKVIAEYAPDRILIEPSGVGKLSDIIGAVLNAGADKVTVNAAVTVVDANKCKMYLKNFGEFFIDQVSHARTIVLSRTANISEAKLKEVLALLREHNADATVITTDWADLDGKTILAAMESGKTDDELLAALAASAAEELRFHAHDDDDDDDDEDEHGHHHHHHDDDEEDEHEHHHHDDDDDDEDEHEHHHHHHHHGHDADEIFTSWGVSTAHKYTAEELGGMLDALDSGAYGTILRAKGIVQGTDGAFIHFDYVPEEKNVRTGTPEVTGKLCVIGADLKEEKLAELFRV